MSRTTSSANDASTPPKSKLLATAAAIGLFVGGFVLLSLPGVPLALMYGVDWLQSPTGLVTATALGQVLMGIAVVGYVRWRGIPLGGGLPSRDESTLIAGTVAVSLAASTGLSFLRQRFTSGQSTNLLSEAIVAEPALALVLIGLSIALIAPAEELLFRGAIQGRLRQSFGRWPSIVGASLLFGAMHLLNFQGSLLGAVLGAAVVGAVSLLWGYVRERTGNVVVPMLVHGLYNAALLGYSYVLLA